MTKLTTEVPKEIIGSYPDGSDEIECLMAKKLLAYEQAGNSPVSDEITIEELQYRIHAHENDLTQMWTADYFLNVQKELLALKQAAKNPVAWVATDSEGFPEYSGHNEFSSSCGVGTPLYAAPVLPKQPESRNEIMAKGVEAFAKDWKGSARYSRISEMACNFAAKLRNGDADEC